MKKIILYIAFMSVVQFSTAQLSNVEIRDFAVSIYSEGDSTRMDLRLSFRLVDIINVDSVFLTLESGKDNGDVLLLKGKVMATSELKYLYDLESPYIKINQAMRAGYGDITFSFPLNVIEKINWASLWIRDKKGLLSRKEHYEVIKISTDLKKKSKMSEK